MRRSTSRLSSAPDSETWRTASRMPLWWTTTTSRTSRCRRCRGTRGAWLPVVADSLEDAVVVDYHDIPHFPVSTVPGHKGRLVAGRLEGRRVLCMQGRFHYYEGWSLQEVVYPVQTFHVMGIDRLFLTNAAGCVNTSWGQAFHVMGIDRLFLTNAAGCVNTSWGPGNLMLITDHIKLMGDSPLRGRNPDGLGPRFFDMSTTWDKAAQDVARSAARKCGTTLREGVYMLFGGPQFETPAEVRLARILGADAVGMSTVPEAIAASHMGMRTLGISCLTNMGAGILDQKLNHEEVLETGERVKGAFTALVREIVRTWM